MSQCTIWIKQNIMYLDLHAVSAQNAAPLGMQLTSTDWILSIQFGVQGHEMIRTILLKNITSFKIEVYIYIHMYGICIYLYTDDSSGLQSESYMIQIYSLRNQHIPWSPEKCWLEDYLPFEMVPLTCQFMWGGGGMNRYGNSKTLQPKQMVPGNDPTIFANKIFHRNTIEI